MCEEHESKESVHGTNTGEELSTLAVLTAVCLPYIRICAHIQAQYVFIHDALEELITCGDTSFSVQNMRVKVNKMSKADPETEITGYQKEFQVGVIPHYFSRYTFCSIQILEKVSRTLDMGDCSDAKMDCNKEKNRFEDFVPCKVITFGYKQMKLVACVFNCS